MKKSISETRNGWVYSGTEVISDPKDADRLFLKVYTEKTDPVTCDAYPVEAFMKIYSKEYERLREYITKNSVDRADLLRTDGGDLCIMISLT